MMRVKNLYIFYRNSLFMMVVGSAISKRNSVSQFLFDFFFTAVDACTSNLLRSIGFYLRVNAYRTEKFQTFMCWICERTLQTAIIRSLKN